MVLFSSSASIPKGFRSFFILGSPGRDEQTGRKIRGSSNRSLSGQLALGAPEDRFFTRSVLNLWSLGITQGRVQSCASPDDSWKTTLRWFLFRSQISRQGHPEPGLCSDPRAEGLRGKKRKYRILRSGSPLGGGGIWLEVDLGKWHSEGKREV